MARTPLNRSRADTPADPVLGTAPEETLLGGAAPAAAYQVSEPETLTSGVVFSSPHSGRAYTDAFLASSRLELQRLRASEDAYVDILIAAAPTFGAPVISAVAPRAYVDLNRDPRDLDPSLIQGASGRAGNARVVAGLGVVPRIVAEGVPIYEGKMPLEEARHRIDQWHAPYHEQLVELLLRARKRFGRALLVDCHSMPSASAMRDRGGRGAAEIVLGDRFGVASERALVDAIEAALTGAGFRVARNTPFAGGYITERFGRPAAGVSAIQIEIDRSLYLDEKAVQPSAGFDALRGRLTTVIEQICGLIDGAARPDLLAAE